MDVINAGTGRNSATADKIPRCVIPRTFNTGFAIELLNKDVRLCLEEADALGVPMIVGTAVRQLLAITMASEGPDADMTEIVKPLERWAGVQVGVGLEHRDTKAQRHRESRQSKRLLPAFFVSLRLRVFVLITSPTIHLSG